VISGYFNAKILGIPPLSNKYACSNVENKLDSSLLAHSFFFYNME